MDMENLSLHAHHRQPGESVLSRRRALDTHRPCAYLQDMDVIFTPDQQAFVRQAIEHGRLQHEEDAVQEALALWEARERARAEILAAVDVAEASLVRGEGRVISDESMREVAADVKQRGRARLAARYSAPRCRRIGSLRKHWPNSMRFGCISPRQVTASRSPTG
jgi:Arc/MetJ-type ribon-helix-helix transcriptional regulator